MLPQVPAENRTQRIHHFGALSNEAFPCPEQYGSGLLSLRLGLDETHFWPLRSNDNRFGIRRIVSSASSRKVEDIGERSA
ncbi:hypothetical protein NKH19_32770 [Mesorhizobium sp. M1338]